MQGAEYILQEGAGCLRGESFVLCVYNSSNYLPWNEPEGPLASDREGGADFFGASILDYHRLFHFPDWLWTALYFGGFEIWVGASLERLAGHGRILC